MSVRFSTDRRRFLQLSSLGIAGAALLSSAPRQLVADVAATAQTTGSRTGRPRKIIFMVSDGMSQAVPSLSEVFSRRFRNRGTHFVELMNNPAVAHGWYETYSLTSLVTDSAAGGSALGGGSRVVNGALNTLPDGTALKPINHLAREHGWGTGVVTTTSVIDATPASFCVAHPTRADPPGIADKYFDVIDVVMGGGASAFDKDQRSDKRDLIGDFQKSGYTVLRSRDEMMALDGEEKRILGLFENGAHPYTLDHEQSDDLIKTVPTLAEMTDKAIRCLEANHSDGWLLQVEGARIDHAAHSNDAPGTIRDQLAFDDAIGIALEFASRHPETLIVVTSDHGNSNPGLSGFGAPTDAMFERVALAKGTTGVVRSALRDHADSPADIHQVVLELLGIDLTGADVEKVSRILKEDYSMVTNRHHLNFVGAFNAVLTNYTGIGWVGTNHTEDYVILLAVGPMQERFNKFDRNTDAFRVMADAMGSDFRNPSMTPEQARQLAAVQPPPFREGDIVHA